MTEQHLLYTNRVHPEDVAKYTAQAYSHILLGLGQVTGRKFAQLIRDNYLATELRHRLCADSAEQFIDKIEYSFRNGVSVTYSAALS